MRQKKHFFAVGVICTAAVLGYLLINQNFFFTPLAHKKCNAAYLPWAWYKNPLQLEYGVLDEDGWKFTKITEKAEIETIFSELSICAEEPLENPQERVDAGCPVWFGVRRLTDGAVLLSAEGSEHCPFYQVRDIATVRLTPKLQDLLAARLRQARIDIQY